MVDRIGNSRILGEIGSGGMAVVYKAVQEPLGRQVAIKALKPSIAMDSQFAERFEREARFMASMQHENILHVYDFVKDGRSMYILMEYVQGTDLYRLLERSPKLPIDVAAIIALQVARALNYAHFRGIVHRDIKPANIMINRRGEVKLMDFGIARDETQSEITETGAGLGTPSYMSPEQILGDKLDFRTDIFSLGIALYQMLTGTKPFVEDDARTVMQKIRLDRFKSPRQVNPAIPRQLERIVARCMEKIPANRYSSTQVLVEDLAEFISSRVPVNYNARIVMFLRETDVISDEEATDILDASASRTIRRRRGDRGLLRKVALIQGLLLCGILGSGAFIQTGVADDSVTANATRPQTGPLVRPEDTCFLEVVVHPWAHVYVDGVQVATTPTAQRIPITPGPHWLRFENPYYHEQTRDISPQPGETIELVIEMQPLVNPEDQEGADDEPGTDGGGPES